MNSSSDGLFIQTQSMALPFQFRTSEEEINDYDDLLDLWGIIDFIEDPFMASFGKVSIGPTDCGHSKELQAIAPTG